MSEITRGMRVAAGKLGLPIDEYVARTAAGEKWCTGCAEWHPRDRFTINRAAKDGLQSWCRAVVAEARRRADEEHNRHLLARLLAK